MFSDVKNTQPIIAPEIIGTSGKFARLGKSYALWVCFLMCMGMVVLTMLCRVGER